MREIILTIEHDDGDEFAEDVLADEIERLMEYVEARRDENDSAAEITAAVIIMAKAFVQEMNEDAKARMN